ncbi:hypothetical protein [Epilithonimonas caeni]|uniref:hypothetical protein n=1 Tax=Epilithonimonas caeni TaxID=365343 RepID=UPI000427859F|nr:hypothetical protein [Epilithonimonas caeni]
MIKYIKEILIWGGISTICAYLLNSVFAFLFSDYLENIVYNAFGLFIIAILSLVVFLFYKKEDIKFELFLRYSFANLCIITIYNFYYFIKFKMGILKYCTTEMISREKFVEACFGSNFMIFVTTFFFLLIFKEKNIKIFTKTSIIYIVLILFLTIVFRVHIIFLTLVGQILSKI